MKKLFLLLLTTLTLSCCNNDDDNTTIAEIDKLPPTTQTGANTAGCLVNGQAFLPGGQSVQPLVCHYLDGETFSLGLSYEINDTYQKVYIYTGNIQLEVGQTYSLTEEINNNSNFGEYYTRKNPLPNAYELHYKTNSLVVGELKITHHDFDNAILSGTFWFDAKFDYAYNYDGTVDENEIIQIREGRFDMQY